LWLWVKLDPSALQYVAFSPAAKDMAENIYRAMWSLLANVLVTVVVTLFTTPKPAKELKGLVYGMTELPSEGHFPIFKRPITWATAVAIGFILLNWLFW
jgi:SSS family solute:Na+ symporter